MDGFALEPSSPGSQAKPERARLEVCLLGAGPRVGSSPVAGDSAELRVASGPKPGQGPHGASGGKRWQEGDQARRREEKCLWGLGEEDTSQGWMKGIHFSLFLGVRGGFGTPSEELGGGGSRTAFVAP